MQNTGYADLHVHTTASDGLHPPEEVVRMAQEAELAAVAITDHDTTEGIVRALAEGERIGITVIPGIEISSVAAGQDIHVLGYYMNIADNELQERLRELRAVRDRRNEMIAAKLNELGIPLDLKSVYAQHAERLQAGQTVGRPHLAEWLLAHGYVSSVKEAFDRFLGKDGAAYTNPPRIHPLEAIALIRRAGGVAVLAHPGLYDRDELIAELVAGGLVGMETRHSDHSPDTEMHYDRLAAAHGLIATGGSDFHGSRGSESFHGPVGNRRVAMTVVDQLNEKKGM
jgi:predicted metal-dependent phosphoesterase TrpH